MRADGDRDRDRHGDRHADPDADDHADDDGIDPDADAHGELPDVIITDADQSGGPGLDLLMKAHGLDGGTPVILLTDAADLELLHEAEALEAAYVFFSPCEVDELRRVTQTFG